MFTVQPIEDFKNKKGRAPHMCFSRHGLLPAGGGGFVTQTVVPVPPLWERSWGGVKEVCFVLSLSARFMCSTECT